MKKISTDEIQSLQNSFEFQEGTISYVFESSQNKFNYFSSIANLLFKCQKCSTYHYFEQKKEYCNSCNGPGKDYLHFDEGSNSQIGIFCRNCNRGFINWICETCGNSNPIEGTFQRLEKKGGGCFIATAVYDDPYADEVIVLKEFRDNYLLNNYLGIVFVKLYYWISPPFAKQIAKKKILIEITKSILIIPLIKFANILKRKEK